MQVTSADDAERMRQALASLCDDAGSFVNEFGPYPVAGSVGASELTETNGEQLLSAHAQGHLLFESAADHSFALSRLFVEPVPTIAPWTCVRGGLEAASMACWLLSDSIDADERISRSLAVRFAGLSQQVRIAGMDSDEASRDECLRRLEEVEAKAISLGFTPIVNRHGKRDGIAQRMPTITQIVGDTLNEERLYRLLSAMAHGHSWALIQLGFLAPDLTEPTLLKKALNSDAAVVLLIAAADIISKPLWARARLFGQDPERLRGLLHHRYREMGLNESRYFWAGDGPS